MKKLFHLSALLLLSTLNPMPRQSETAAGQPSNKTKSMKNKVIVSFIALLSLLSGITHAAPLGTAFTYQGRLTDGANPATGGYDLRFAVYDTVTNGTLKVVVTNTSVAVTNGLFTTPVDFGLPPLNFNAMWLEIGVRTNGSTGDFSVVSPRQALLPAPYAFYALNSSNAVTAGVASNLLGVLPTAQLAGTYSGALSLNNANNNFAGAFTGNGTGLTNVNAATLGGLGAGNFWQTGGNSGTTAGVNFLGTTDNQPLELKVKNVRALRLEPTINDLYHSNFVNVVGGSPVNYIASGVYGSVIGGGGALYYYDGPCSNSVAADLSFLGGGEVNSIQADADHSFLGGGGYNSIQTNAYFSVLGGGDDNSIQANANNSVLGGGTYNSIQANADHSILGGGEYNSIQTNADHSVLGGGGYNSIQPSAGGSFLGGGYYNSIQTNSESAFLGGGAHNSIQPYAFSSFLGGGEFNSCAAEDATVPGGDHNVAAGANSFAAGHRAKANYQGDFVWADSTEADFASTGDNQFLIRAAGGVGIGKNNPGAALDVSGSITASGRLGIGNGAPAFPLDVTAPQAVARFITTNNINGSVLVLDNTTPGLTYHGAVNFNDGAGQIGYLTTGAMTFTTSNGERMRILNNGNVGVGNTNPGYLLVVGNSGSPAYCNGTTWQNGSDRDSKEAFAAINPRTVLEKVLALPITEWKYKAETDGTRHLGPVAQDFHAAFGLNGPDDKHIATVDEEGVALAAIQGLNQKLMEKDAEIQALKQSVAELKETLTHLTQQPN